MPESQEARPALEIVLNEASKQSAVAGSINAITTVREDLWVDNL